MLQEKEPSLVILGLFNFPRELHTLFLSLCRNINIDHDFLIPCAIPIIKLSTVKKLEQRLLLSLTDLSKSLSDSYG